MASGIQENNGGPVGYGQPNRGMRRRIMRPEDEQFEQMQLNPELMDNRGQGQPPHVYPEQPQGIPTAYRNQGQWGNQAMPGRTPMSGGQDQYGQNAYSQQAYRNVGPPLNADVAGMRNALATPMVDKTQGPQIDVSRYQQPGDPSTGTGRFGAGAMPGGVPPVWQQHQQQRNGGFNAQRPGTSGPVDPRLASPESGYGWGGVQNPQYQGGPQGAQAPNDYAALQAAVQQSMTGFTDIAGMRDVFKPGQYMNQLEGFNTNAWGTNERGSNTLKNMFGTIASNHDVSQPGALNRALPDIRKALPNATIVSHANEDLLDPDGPDGPMAPVDVIRAATPGGAGAGWQWAPTDQMGQPGMNNGPQGPATQMYNNAITQMTPRPNTVGPDGAPEVQDSNSAMQFLQWLMSQQQQGQMPL